MLRRRRRRPPWCVVKGSRSLPCLRRKNVRDESALFGCKSTLTPLCLQVTTHAGGRQWPCRTDAKVQPDRVGLTPAADLYALARTPAASAESARKLSGGETFVHHGRVRASLT